MRKNRFAQRRPEYKKILVIDSRDNRLLWTSGLRKIVFAYEISVRERELSIGSLLNNRREFV